MIRISTSTELYPFSRGFVRSSLSSPVSPFTPFLHPFVRPSIRRSVSVHNSFFIYPFGGLELIFSPCPLILNNMVTPLFSYSVVPLFSCFLVQLFRCSVVPLFLTEVEVPTRTPLPASMRREAIESADFAGLKRKFRGIQVSDSMRRLFKAMGTI